MSKIHIEYSHNLTTTEPRERLAPLFKNLLDKYGVTTEWASDVKAAFSRNSLNGDLTLGDGLVTIEMSLAFAMSPLKGTIEQHVKGWLGQFLNPEQKPSATFLPTASGYYWFRENQKLAWRIGEIEQHWQDGPWKVTWI